MASTRVLSVWIKPQYSMSNYLNQASVTCFRWWAAPVVSLFFFIQAPF